MTVRSYRRSVACLAFTVLHVFDGVSHTLKGRPDPQIVCFNAAAWALPRDVSSNCKHYIMLLLKVFLRHNAISTVSGASVS